MSQTTGDRVRRAVKLAVLVASSSLSLQQAEAESVVQLQKAKPLEGAALSADGKLIALPTASYVADKVNEKNVHEISFVSVSTFKQLSSFVVDCAATGRGPWDGCPSRAKQQAAFREANKKLSAHSFSLIRPDYKNEEGDEGTGAPSNSSPLSLSLNGFTVVITTNRTAALFEVSQSGKIVARDWIAYVGDGRELSVTELALVNLQRPVLLVATRKQGPVFSAGANVGEEEAWRIIPLDGSLVRDVSKFVPPRCSDRSSPKGGVPPLEYAAWCETADGQKVGTELRWFENGALARNTAWNVREDGPYSIWDERGNLVEEGEYVRGDLHGTVKTWKNGKLTVKHYQYGAAQLTDAEQLDLLRAPLLKSGNSATVVRHAEATVKRHCAAVAETYRRTAGFYGRCFGAEEGAYTCPSKQLASEQKSIESGMQRTKAILEGLKPDNTKAYADGYYDDYTRFLRLAMKVHCPEPPRHPWFSN